MALAGHVPLPFELPEARACSQDGHGQGVPARDGLLAMVRSFSKMGQYKTTLPFLGLLGLMAATLQLVEYTLLHMHPIQWFLKWRWNHVTHRLRYKILGPKPSASVVVGQGTPFTGSALFLTQHHHHYHYRCEHGGLGRSLPAARVDHSTLQWPLVEVRTLTPHKCAGAQSSSPDPTPSGAGNPWSVSTDRV